MPVKKTTIKKPVEKKTIEAKKAPIKKVEHKTTHHVAAKKVEHKVANHTTVKKPDVIVETKKTTKESTCMLKKEGTMKIVFVLLLLLNLVFGVLNFMKQNSALELEEMKVGGHDNLVKVMQLYESDFYKEQQSAAIQQFMAQ